MYESGTRIHIYLYITITEANRNLYCKFNGAS